MVTTMMSTGDPHLPNPTVHFPTAHIHSPSHYDAAAFSALQRFLPSNTDGCIPPAEGEHPDPDFDFPADAFSCDNFQMFEFKVKMCGRVKSHDWTDCPFAHPGEKARRRDPRSHRYSGTACPDFRRGACGKGDGCEHAHGVFERWLHPLLYRTQPCKDGTRCRRRICFFAHAPDQLRVLAGSPNGSPRRPEYVPFAVSGSSPTNGSLPIHPGEFLKPSLQLSKMKMGLSTSRLSGGLGFGSPRIRPGFMCLPTTTVRAVNRFGPSPFDTCREEPAMERVESGKALREKIYAKLGKDNSLERVDPVPDVGWVWELVK